MFKHFDDLDVADVVCDMHGKNFACFGTELEPRLNVKEKIELFDAVELHTEVPLSKWLSKHISMFVQDYYVYPNKMLVVIDDWFSNDESGWIVAYSCDGRRAGIAKIRKMENAT